jgi:hypothetical protein
MRFVQLASGADTVPCCWNLARADHLWDRNPERRLYPGTPHCHDRYHGQIHARRRFTMERAAAGASQRVLASMARAAGTASTVFALMARVGAVELAASSLRSCPRSDDPSAFGCRELGARVLQLQVPHHARRVLALVRCEDEACRFETGTIWTFDNLLVHSVECVGDGDRIVAIVSMRCE